MDDMNLNSYIVGEQRPEWIHEEGLEMELDTTAGLFGFVFIDRPTAAERIAIKENRQFKVAFVDYGNLGFFVTSVSGCFEWDAPFSPNIYTIKRDVRLLTDETQGLSLVLLFIDSSTGTLFHLRQIGLGHDFSNRFIKWYQESIEKYGPMSREDYHTKIDQIYARYTIAELGKQASFVWRLR